MRKNIASPTETRGAIEYLNALTSLRFFAATHVLLFHYQAMFFYNYHRTPPIEAIWLGFTGVTFFFVLSGFILAHNYSSVQFDAATLRRYAFARFSRIYPVYLLSLLVALPFLLKSLPWKPDWLRPLWLASTVLAPLGLHAWVPGAACALNCPSWSISAEFFFYLMFPLLMPLALRRPLAFAGSTALFWLISSLFYIWLWQQTGDKGSIILGSEARGKWAALLLELIEYFPLGRLPEFMIGIAAYVFWSAHRERISAFVGFSFFAAMAAIILLFHKSIPEIMLQNGATAVAWVSLIVAAASTRGGVLTHPIAVFLGQVSFSLYLLHIPVALAVFAVDTLYFERAFRDWPWTMATLAATLSLLVSSIVFSKFEEPCRRILKRRFSQRQSQREIQTARPTQA
jgi:peptidoglycan/LPS O-acetylase OafA/YrhL